MNPIFIITFFILPFLKDLFSGAGKIFDSREGKAILVLIGGYLLYSYFNNKQKQAEYLSGNSKAGKWAIRMNEALHPFLNFKIPLLGYLDDGTTESEVEAVGNEVGKANQLSDLVAAYKALYNSDILPELVKEGVNEIFETAYELGLQKKSVPVATGGNVIVSSTPNSGASIKNEKNLIVAVGNSYVTKGGVNLRQTSYPYAVSGITKAGETYRVYQLKKNMYIGGVPYIVAFVQYEYLGVPVPFKEYMVIINAFTAKA